MIKLAAFADEISPNLDEQIRVCKLNGITHFELRGVNKLNVLDFDQPLRNEIRTKLQANGLAVACIGSPIGKAKINDPWEVHFDRFKIAVELAQFFAAPLIRIFSYYPADKTDDRSKYRDQVIRRMQAKADYIKNIDVTLAHENEKEIYGETGRQCLDLLQAVNSPKFRAVFDFANFIQAGDTPLDNWTLLKPYTIHIHIKDTKRENNTVMVPAGQGDGQIGAILADLYKSGYQGFLTLEPHLMVAGHSHGETGPDLFKVAVDALRKVLADAGIR